MSCLEEVRASDPGTKASITTHGNPTKNEISQTQVISIDQAKSSILELDPEIVGNSANQTENGSGSVVITPTGVSKTSSIDDITTCTTSSDISTPMELSLTAKRPRTEISFSDKLDSDTLEPTVKAQNLDLSIEIASKNETQMQSSFIQGPDMTNTNTSSPVPNNSIVFKCIDASGNGVDINNRTESNSTEVIPTSEASKSTTASASPLNQNQGCKDELSSGVCMGAKQPALLSSKQLFDELVQLAAVSPTTGTGNIALMNPQQLASLDNGVLQQSLQNFGLLMGAGLGVPSLGATGNTTPIKVQSPSVTKSQLIGGAVGSASMGDFHQQTSVGTAASASTVPSSVASPLTSPINLSSGSTGHGTTSPISGMVSQNQNLAQNQFISQLMANPLFQTQAIASQSSQNLNRMVSAAFGVGSPQNTSTSTPFGWPSTGTTATQGFCPTGTQSGIANFATLLAAANSQLHAHTPFPLVFPTPVNRSIGSGSNPILMPMQSAAPSDGSAFEGAQTSTTASTAPSETGAYPSTIGQQNDPLLRLSTGLPHNSSGAPCIPPFWHNPALLASAASLIGSGDLSQTMALLNAGPLNLQTFVQAQAAEPSNAQNSNSEEESVTRTQQNCIPLLTSLQQPSFDFSSLSTSSPAALAALASAATNAQLSSNAQTQETETTASKSVTKVSNNARISHGSGSRALNASSSVTAAAAALDHLDVDWDSVGLREAELAAMEICKTANTLFDTTDGTTPVPSSPAAVGEAVLTAAQLTISARAMLKFVKGLTPTQLGINWHACTQRFCVTYTTRDEQNPRSWTLGAYSNGKLHYKYFGPRSWTVMGLKEALRKAFKARTSLLLGQGIIEEPEDTGLSKEELTYHARQLLQQLRDSLGVKKGNVHKGLYISWHPKTRRFVVALKSCESGKTIYKYFSPKERSIKGIKTALLDAHQMVVAACQ
ncbi:uncharacterized protein cubi_01005 [Cryptosporidium ubiquitum]|uniref:Uncharacterized protein n=1 Tax=Cryptosporidium ubiquitum TaxID=857276 RepID=A0A1J4MCX7_9CRYT|nr:uncharacterized protein cubi_01005 [Cryptosporidium ubiquitum]OII70860.1 hypothetical protein cubi_01005 [Cryptosporidium ubiquitum]